jgi:hypothetical protein
MEFTYKISEEDYVNAYILQARNRSSALVKDISFWVLIAVCLLLLFGVTERLIQSPADAEDSAPIVMSSVVLNILPAVIAAALFIFFRFFFPKMRIRRMYRNDPALQSEITLNVTADSIACHTSAGSTSQSAWSIYKCWREGKDVLTIAYHSGVYFVVSLAGLSEPQRAELRSILTAALPKK